MPKLPSQIQRLRQEFPILAKQINGQALIYLDNAATTQKPNAVLDCMQQYYTESNSNVHRASHVLSAEATYLYENARKIVASYVNARSSREIIWTRGTTESINLVANSWGASLKQGDEIILSTLEHHANIVPWQLLAQRTGALIKVIPLLPNGDVDLASYSNLLSDKTRMVAITHASNAIGTINPIKEMIAQAHSVGAITLIDGAQALPHLQIDLKELDADFYAFSGHKLYAPTGIGVLYGKQALLEAMPPWQGGGEMISKVSFEQSSYNELPLKFEAGTPNISGAIALAKALEWLNSQNRALLEQHESNLFNYALECCSTIKGWNRIGSPKESVSLISFTLENLHQQDIGHLLDQQGIAVRSGHHCAMPLMQTLALPGTTRASFAFYNTFEEVERFAEAIDRMSSSSHESSSAVTAPPDAQPATTSILAELLALKDWNARYRQIMLHGKIMNSASSHIKTDANLIKGCESNTWLSYKLSDDQRIIFYADSDARIIRGLLALVIDIFNNKTVSEIRSIDIDDIFNQLSLERHLSPSRGNGLRAVVDKIYQIAEDRAH